MRTASARRWRRWAAAVGLGLLALPGLVFGSAYLLKDHSGIARAIIWMDADTGDHRRFPARVIEAPQRAAPLERAPVDLDAERVSGRPLADLLSTSATTAFIVLRGDTVVYERYFGGDDRTSIQTSFSVAKSFASALVGIALEEGAIGGVDDPITRYLPELLERDRRFGQITIAHLISMTSGLRYEESGLPWGDDAQTYYGTDLRDLALSDTEIVEPPGTRWHYNNYNPLLLGMILERATGVPVAEYLERKLWKPLGAEFDASWSLDSEDSGFEKMESGINARAIDFARLGVLYLNDGRWLGRQIVPRSWIRASTSAAPAAYHYGYWWWLEPGGAFLARGNLGQFVFVDPRREVVIARFGEDEGGVYWSSVFEQVASLAVTERSEAPRGASRAGSTRRAARAGRRPRSRAPPRRSLRAPARPSRRAPRPSHRTAGR
jgi:CubicO group peptidase (beta-lactamase class C family)